MLTGFAFLDCLGEDYVNEHVWKRQLTEVGSVECCRCQVKYRLFAGPDLPKDKVKAESDIKDLKERLLHMMAKDCPKSVGEGQPQKARIHHSMSFLRMARLPFNGFQHQKTRPPRVREFIASCRG